MSAAGLGAKTVRVYIAAIRGVLDFADLAVNPARSPRLRLAMTRACKHAGIPAFTPHDLRHRYISLLVMAGVPLPVVREVVGHSRASVTLDVYSHVLMDEPAELLRERLELAMGRSRCDTGVRSAPKRRKPRRCGALIGGGG